MQINFLVGGEAGQGVQTVGFIIAKVLSRGGQHVFADQDYESRIRGGHNFFRVRASDAPVHSFSRSVDILIALNKETLDLHSGEVGPGGLILVDQEKTNVGAASAAFRVIDVPMEKMAVEITSGRLVANTIAIGAALGLLAYDFDILSAVLREQFSKAGKDVAEDNVRAARAGYDLGAGNRPEDYHRFEANRAGEKRLLLNGNEAMALGAMAAGVKFIAAYPMTPTTQIMEYASERARDYGLVVFQPEDEISAINMVVGAAYAGVRAMTVTSGSGFCLMVEGLGLAGMTETPTVVVLGQRPGPAVGLPTRTEQGELLFACFAGTGEFPRVVLAPATIGDCFWAAVHAFNLADKYQTLVVLLSDHVLGSSYQTVERPDLKKVIIDRGDVLSDADAGAAVDYRRYLITESGVSSRAFPMQGKALVVADSDEHDESGHITEDAAMRTAMVRKRLRKLKGMRSEEWQLRHDTEAKAETTIIAWGSTYGAVHEAVQKLVNSGVPVNHLHLNQVWPFPAEQVKLALSKTKHSLVVENNATGQMARLISSETGMTVSGGVNKFDGRPFSADEIVAAVTKEASRW